MQDPKERFNSKLIKTSSCWEWQAAKTKAGYGCFYYNGRQDMAHRVSYMLYRGDIPEGLFVCHTCDNKSCVNPDHLFLGTNSDNIKDCVQKGLFGDRSKEGIKNPRVKLTEKEVLEIRALYPKIKSVRKIGKMYGVNSGTISCIVNRKSWRHI